jgi:predicted ATPase
MLFGGRGRILPDVEAIMRIDPSVWPAGAPRRVSSFVGRSEELTVLSARLTDSRLLTVTGPGGVGKTSLVAQLLGDVHVLGGRKVAWAALGATTDPDQVPYLVLDAVGIGDARGQDPVERLTGWLGARRLLLVLDNCEHLAGARA